MINRVYSLGRFNIVFVAVLAGTFGAFIGWLLAEWVAPHGIESQAAIFGSLIGGFTSTYLCLKRSASSK